MDVTSDESVQAGLRRVRHGYGERIASVIHLAAYYDFSGEPSSKYEEVTIGGAERLLRGLQDFDVEQFNVCAILTTVGYLCFVILNPEKF